MIFSMTGFSRNSHNVEDTILNLDIKSVNHRFLDVTVKMPDSYRHLELPIKKLIGKYMTRGKVEIKINIADSCTKSMPIDDTKLKRYINTIKQIDNITNQTTNLDAITIFNSTDLLIHNRELLIDDDDFLSSVKKLLIKINKMQEQEGKNIKKVIFERLDSMLEITTELPDLINNANKNYQTQLKSRISAISKIVDEQRISQELVLFFQRSDVMEEIDRLNSHIDAFVTAVNNLQTPGKRLDFICQEMNREANTLGSKSVSKETTKRAIDLKVLIEQIREQVQNVM